MLIKKTIESCISSYKRKYTEDLKPKWLWFGVTDKCNSRCTHCNIWSSKNIGDMSLEQIEKMFTDPLFSDLEVILNSGGEAILRQDMKELLLLEHKLFPKATLHISTNGLLPDKVIELAKVMSEKDIPLEVGVSLDGVGEVHDQIRGVEGNFAKVEYLLGELSLLKERSGGKINFIIGFTLSEKTVDNYDALKAYANSRNWPLSIQWYNYAPFYSNEENVYSEDVKTKMLNIIKSYPYDFYFAMWQKDILGKSIKFPCYALNTFCAIKSNGEIVPCFNNWDKSVGNVTEASPTEIWHSKNAKKCRRYVSSCSGCLNSWGIGWSILSDIFPVLKFYLTKPLNILKRGKVDKEV